MTEVIFRHHGTFDKYVGDEVMAFFGAPVATGDDAMNALKAAVEMQQIFARIRDLIPSPDVSAAGLGIGLHSGEVAVGNVGSERVMSYTVIGDTVNTAHRLQSIAPSGEVIISEATYHQVAERIQATRLKPIAIKGKRDPMTIYRVSGWGETDD